VFGPPRAGSRMGLITCSRMALRRPTRIVSAAGACATTVETGADVRRFVATRPVGDRATHLSWQVESPGLQPGRSNRGARTFMASPWYRSLSRGTGYDIRSTQAISPRFEAQPLQRNYLCSCPTTPWLALHRSYDRQLGSRHAVERRWRTIQPPSTASSGEEAVCGSPFRQE
jgi:hypothetical protein